MTLANKYLVMFIVSLALFMDVLDSNIINTAIPAMSKSFGVHPIDLKIALISYLLSIAIFIPMSGWVADRFGTKRIFVLALGLFTASSTWCGYTHTLHELIIARSIQGIGGAFMLSLGRLIIARTFPRHELVGAMNAVIIVVAVAVMLGPFIGGIITVHLSWPWIFWVNIPAGIFAILLAMFGLKDTAPKNERPFDILGFILFGTSLAMLMYSLAEISNTDANFVSAAWMIALACTMLVAFTLHAKQALHPIIKTKLFRIRTFRVSVIGNLTARLGFGGMPFLLPLLFQIGLGFNAELSGALLVPMAFGIIFSKLIVLKILRFIGYKYFLLANTLFVGFVLWAFLIIRPTTPLFAIASMTFILGIFIAAQFTGMNSLAYADVHNDELSAITTITSTTQILSQSLGVAVAAIFLRCFTSISATPTLLTITVFHQTFIAMGVMTFFSALTFISMKKDDGNLMLVSE